MIVAVIDALIGILQRLRISFAGSEKGPPAELEPSAVRTPFLFLLALVLGALCGMLFSYSLFSKMISNQANRIEAQRDEISAMGRETRQLEESEASYREELTATRQELSDAVRTLNQNKLELTAKPRGVGGSANRGVAKGSAFPEFGGNKSKGGAEKNPTCDVESADPGKGMERCLTEANKKGKK